MKGRNAEERREGKSPFQNCYNPSSKLSSKRVAKMLQLFAKPASPNLIQYFSAIAEPSYTRNMRNKFVLDVGIDGVGETKSSVAMIIACPLFACICGRKKMV